jgi:hypothetical protein
MNSERTPDFAGIAARLDHMIGLAQADEIEWPNEDSGPCCTNQGLNVFPLSPDGLIPRPQ